MRIPAHSDFLGADDKAALNAVFDDKLLASDGAVCQRVQHQLKNILLVEQVLLTQSGGRALDLAMQTLGLGRNDEMIVPAFASAESANSVAQCGATPVFADVDPITLNLDPQKIERLITPKTKAILVNHFGGNAAPMNSLIELATNHNLYVVECATDAFDAKYKHRYLGTIGHVGCFSFDATKTVSCGTGGALVTNDLTLAARSLHIHSGNKRLPISRGGMGQESWQVLGGSYALSDLLAAVLECQLTKRAEIKRKRKMIWHRYYEALQPLVSAESITLPKLSPQIEPNYHLFYALVNDTTLRNRLVYELHKFGIMASASYVPLHRSPYGKRFSTPNPLPVAEKIGRSIICLPIYPALTERAASFIATTFESILIRLTNAKVAKFG